MAKTSFATNDPLVKKAWEEKLYREIEAESYFAKFMGRGQDTMVSVKDQLTKQSGDQITFGLRGRLTGAGVTSGQMLEGNEEKLNTASFSVILEQYRHATRDKGRLDRQRVMFSIDEEAKAALKVWGAEKMDQLLIDAVLADPTRIIYKDGTTGAPLSAGSSLATAKAAISAANSKLTPNFIMALGTVAKISNSSGSQRIQPVSIGGREMYVLLVNPAALYDLRIDATFQSFMKDAMERGKDNPLFKDAVAIVGNVVVHESERVPLFTDGGGGNVVGCMGVLMGAQALVWANGQRQEIVAEEFDYKNEHGYAIEMIGKAGKAKFGLNGATATDYAVISVVIAATNLGAL